MNLWNEIWGCVNYLNISYDTIMQMPVHIRKFWIEKHNMQNNKENGGENSNANAIGNANINAYAEMEQNKLINNKKIPH